MVFVDAARRRAEQFGVSPNDALKLALQGDGYIRPCMDILELAQTAEECQMKSEKMHAELAEKKPVSPDPELNEFADESIRRLKI